jgi:hypothetical protein
MIVYTAEAARADQDMVFERKKRIIKKEKRGLDCFL